MLKIRRPPSPLALRRLTMGLSQTEVGERAGVRGDTVSRLERGDMPQLRTARKIAAVLDTTVEELFPPGNDEGPARPPSPVQASAPSGRHEEP